MHLSRMFLSAAVAAALVPVLAAAGLPKVWTSCGGVRTAEDLAATTDDLAAHGVDVFELPPDRTEQDIASELRAYREVVR